MRKPSTGSGREERHRHDLDAAERERAADRERRQLRQAAALLLRRLEDVGEHAPHARERVLVGNTESPTAASG
jgi:hypothetical protein